MLHKILTKNDCWIIDFDGTKVLQFLNQVRVSRRPARARFLKIDSVWIVSMCVCVCVSAPEAINN